MINDIIINDEILIVINDSNNDNEIILMKWY